MMSVGGLGLARGGTGASSRVRAPMAGPSSPSAELQRRAGPSAAVKLSWAESVLLWAVMEMRGGAWLPGGMGDGAFLKLKAAARNAETRRMRNASQRVSVAHRPTPTRCQRAQQAASSKRCYVQSRGLFSPSSGPERQAGCPRSHSTAVAGASARTQGTLQPWAGPGWGAERAHSQEPGLPETEAGAARRGRQSSS